MPCSVCSVAGCFWKAWCASVLPLTDLTRGLEGGRVYLLTFLYSTFEIRGLADILKGHTCLLGQKYRSQSSFLSCGVHRQD